MNDAPYTTPEEDPFNVQPLLLQPRRRRSSLLNKWIQEQQTQPHILETPTNRHPPIQPHSAPCVRYLDLSFDRNLVLDDTLTLNSYDLVEDDDIPRNGIHDSGVPSTPTLVQSPRTLKMRQTPSPFRGFNISFRSASPSLSHSSEGSLARPSSRISIFPRTPRHSTGASSAKSAAQQHNGSSSVNLTGKNSSAREPVDIGASHRWRPNVLGHFHGSSTSQTSIVPSDTVYSPSRPSVSSGDTYTSATTAISDCHLPLTPPRVRFMDSIRSLNRSSGKGFSTSSGIASSSSLVFQDQSLCTDLLSRHARSLSSSDRASCSTIDDEISTVRLPLAPKQKSRLATSNVDHDEDDGSPAIRPKLIKQPDPTRAHVVYSSGGTLSRVNFASLRSRQKKKRKLVISGVGRKDSQNLKALNAGVRASAKSVR